jgi:hypothetical protein
MIGYKAFNKGLIGYNNFKYIVGQTYHHANPLVMGSSGFHFCLIPIDLDNFYDPGSYNYNYGYAGDIEYAQVLILGQVIHDTKNHQSITDKIKIIKKITRENFFDLFEEGLHQLKSGDQINIIKFNQKSYLHNFNDKPAILRINGGMEWFAYSQRHRNKDLPAAIFTDDDWQIKEWYKDGKIHRDNDMPALIAIHKKGIAIKQWCKNGIVHRDNNLPALINEETSLKEWWYNGRKYK